MLRSVREQDLRFWMEYFPPFSLITTHLYVGAPGISWYNSPQYSSTAPSYGMNKTSQLPPLQSFSWCRCCSWQFQVFGSCGSFIIPHVINTQRAVPIITIYIYILFTSALLLIHADVSVFNKGHQYVISWTISPCAYLCNWCYQGVEIFNLKRVFAQFESIFVSRLVFIHLTPFTDRER